MHVFTTNDGLSDYLQPFRSADLVVGCVPTMGALHKGHMALMERAIQESDLTVATIFVNPTQFNEKTDLTKYPRPLANDLGLLEGVGVDVLFLPTESEVYPADFKGVPVDLAGLDLVMEGKFRPGHFEGVVTVVHRLLELVQPQRLYMGLKDYQQQAIIAHSIRALDLPVSLVPCTIVREKDGLAYSSRNVRLTESHRRVAPQIHAILLQCKEELGHTSLANIQTNAQRDLDKLGFRPEYIEFVDGRTLQAVQNVEDHDLIVVCVAAWLGEVRLIDNMVMKGQL